MPHWRPSGCRKITERQNKCSDRWCGHRRHSFIETRGLSFEIGEADGYVVENTRLQVTGDLYEPDTNHHYTPLIMHVTGGLY